LLPGLFSTEKKARGEKSPENDVWLFITSNAPIKSKFQHPYPRENPRHLTIFFTRGVGSLISKAFPGLGIDLCLGVAMKIETEVSGFK